MIRPNCSRLLAMASLACWWLLPAWPAVAQSISEHDEPAASSVQFPSGSVAHWVRRGTPAGTPVRLRVRGEVLEYLLGGGNWALQGPAGDLEARIVLPPDPAEPAVSELAVLSSKYDSGDLLVDIDRGEDQFAINRLELRLAHSSVLCMARIAASVDGQSYTQVGGNQLIYQRITGGQFVRLTTLSLDETGARYIRVRLVGQAELVVESARAWFETDYDYPVYKVYASLGTMRSGAVPGESVWPLILENNSQALLKLKLLSSASGEVRPVRLTQQGSDPAEPVNESAAVWAGEVQQAGLTLSQKWIQLQQLGYGDDWSLVVDDGENAILPLTNVEAYAAEVFIELLMPESPEESDSSAISVNLTLWQADTGPQESEPLETNGAEPVLVGEFTGWNTSQPVHEPAEPMPIVGSLLSDLWWTRPAAYLAGAIILLVIGLILLRRPVPRY